MELSKRELLTIPNALTAGRFLAASYVAYKLYKNPRKWWLRAIGLGLTDKDGFFARLGDGIKNSDGSYRRPPNERLQNMGFRGSEIGRILDPTADMIYTGEVIIAGTANKVMPKPLAALLLAQKALVAYQTLDYRSKGIDIQVSRVGQYSEAVTDIGIAMLFAAESLDNQIHKDTVRSLGISVTLAGLAGKSYAGFYQYRQQAQRLTSMDPLANKRV